MASKTKTVFICSECGFETPKWGGKCPNCGEWNTLNEETVTVAPKSNVQASVSVKLTAEKLGDISVDREFRYSTGIKELDRVLGGGLVKGSVVLLSGDPGIGKSTLLMQMCDKMSDRRILYVSGEESSGQLKIRAKRLNVSTENLTVMTETDVEGICEYIKINKPEIVLIDSIQTMNLAELTSSSGTVTQVRECTAFIQRTCKAIDIPVILVGHVNKDGAVAGPKVMEHIVDAVLYFEGERNHSYRILRAIKNRYGSTNEIGVFEMGDSGLVEVENPSSMLLSERNADTSGTCITCVMEGTRPLLAEIQGLVSNTGYGNARRMATGFDYNRMNLLLAVLEKRLGFVFSNFDVYINVVGGLKLDEPACDLSVALALISGLKDKPISADLVAFGEVGLSGEVRSVSRIEARIKEAERLGFKQCIIPYSCLKKSDLSAFQNIEIIGVHSVKEAIYHLF